ncbi:bifunctional peptidase and arginyl-hydroxylase JMJD5-like isoform X2 [Euwallacea fornicatus]|uniref:bifunctional peptidase and arginyl-hydroxylase JMJD5-like isoform X2 n=1 Tax=Euwallacea fornicatus TaxID=995702 RepID=UPI00338F5605
MNLLNKESIIQHVTKLAKNPIIIQKENFNCDFLLTFEKCLKTCFDLQHPDTNADVNMSWKDRFFDVDCILDYIHDELNTDMGLLLGAPIKENPELLNESAKYLQVQLNCLETRLEGPAETLKRKLQDDDMGLDQEFNELRGVKVETRELPSIETFNKNFFIPQIPVKLTGCMAHWPASTKWLDVNYLLNVAGSRTVPIEIGSHYTDESWSQKLMTLKDFISQHYLSKSGKIGYLAQHNLFDQITELREDIRVPDYCCCSLNYLESSEPDINAWLGPKGTVSPLHQDPKNNILAQVYGTKRLLLFSPEDTPYLYPHGEKMLSNTAQVDPLKPDDKFPDFNKAKMYKCLLQPGEMLFIPQKWWHHVTALDKSFSVSFWWQ